MMLGARTAAWAKSGKHFPGAIITVRITNDNLECALRLYDSDGIIDWGDGDQSLAQQNNNASHIYQQAGDYQVRIDAITNFIFGTKSQIYELNKWPEGLKYLSATGYRNMTNCRFIAGWDGTYIQEWTFYMSTRDAEYIEGNESCAGPFPNVTKLESLAFSYMRKLKFLYLDGTIESMERDSLSETGLNLPADAQGYKCVIRVANTCDSLLAVANFPGGAPNATKWQCADGNVIYRGKYWIKEPL